MTATTATAIKAGAMVTGGSLIADLVIFQDESYIYLAIVGAIVSMFGVLHDVFGEHSGEYSCPKICVEATKGMALGVFAIPFWYLSITQGVIQKLMSIDTGEVSNSLALIVAFGLSWYTVPIFNWVAGLLKRRIK